MRADLARKLLFRVLLVLAGLTNLPSISAARTLEVIAAPRVVMAAVSVQSLSVAKFVSVTTDTVIVDSWMTAGTSALQADNSDEHNTDVTCPVRLARSGSIATFSNPRFEEINDEAEWVDLSTSVLQAVKIVARIKWCKGEAIVGPTINGCADATQIVLAAEAALTPETLAHEYGHYKGRRDMKQPGFERWLLFGQGLPNRNIVDEGQCEAYAR